MKREEKSRKTRELIINVSRRLFIRQGYAATTVRQILREAGLTTGTLYHFFDDKEDIFKQIASDYLEDTKRIISSLAGKNTDPVIEYALIISFQLTAAEKHDAFAELYLNAYGMWGVFEIICKNSAARNRAFFGQHNRGLGEDEWFARSLAINAIMQKCIAERINGGRIPYLERLRLVLTVAFTLFNISRERIDPAIAKARKILRSKNILIYGVRIKSD